jgi:AcrR family transcriptional regulator
MDTSCSESLRADAARNRAALVTAAHEVFAERGLDAPLDDIARRAGVGNATLYRRFPTRQALVTAVFTERMVDYARAVDDALAHPDPWQGFCRYVYRVMQLQADDRGMADLLVTTCGDGEIERLRADGLRGVRELIARAQDAHRLRPDFVHQDLVLLLMANAGLLRRTAGPAAHAWQRLAAFVLDGLQTKAATATAPPVSERGMAAAMAAQRCSVDPGLA